MESQKRVESKKGSGLIHRKKEKVFEKSFKKNEGLQRYFGVKGLEPLNVRIKT